MARAVPADFIAAESHPDLVVRSQALEIVKGLYGTDPINGLDQAIEWFGVSPMVPVLGGMKSAY